MLARRTLLGVVGCGITALAGCSSGGGGTGSPTDSPTATVAPAYDIELDSEFDPSALSHVEDDDATATIHVTVEKVIDPETLESEALFERHVDVDGPTTRSWPDAFAVDEDAVEFVIGARYESGHESWDHLQTMRDTFRFAPGSYSTPDTASFTVVVETETSSQNITHPRVIIEA